MTVSAVSPQQAAVAIAANPTALIDKTPPPHPSTIPTCIANSSNSRVHRRRHRCHGACTAVHSHSIQIIWSCCEGQTSSRLGMRIPWRPSLFRRDSPRPRQLPLTRSTCPSSAVSRQPPPPPPPPPPLHRRRRCLCRQELHSKAAGRRRPDPPLERRQHRCHPLVRRAR